jgi:hypothetical protein
MKMKKLLVFLLVAVLALCSLSASVSFVFGDLGQHPDILGGFLPSYLLIGAGFDLPQLIEGNTTELRLLVGDGYTQRVMWLDENTGENLYDSGTWTKDNALRYNVWQNTVSLRFVQGFLTSPVNGKDLLTLIINTDVNYEKYYSGSKFLFFNIKGNYDDIIASDYSGRTYPDLNGHDGYLGVEIGASLKLDLMTDTLHTNDGMWTRVNVKVGPAALNKAQSGHASYFSIVWNTVGAKTLYNLTSSDGASLFSIVLADRVNASYTTGDAVPASVIGPVSLGRKVRGYNTYTYGTEFSLVNNFDIRFAGPDVGISGIAPRLNLFFDCGYGWGKVFNTDRSEKNFLSSVGAQIEMSFFDFIDLGFQMNWLPGEKEKYTQPGHFTWNFTFFLDF